jgi:hypothetical protein
VFDVPELRALISGSLVDCASLTRNGQNCDRATTYARPPDERAVCVGYCFGACAQSEWVRRLFEKPPTAVTFPPTQFVLPLTRDSSLGVVRIWDRAIGGWTAADRAADRGDFFSFHPARPGRRANWRFNPDDASDDAFLYFRLEDFPEETALVDEFCANVQRSGGLSIVVDGRSLLHDDRKEGLRRATEDEARFVQTQIQAGKIAPLFSGTAHSDGRYFRPPSAWQARASGTSLQLLTILRRAE